MTLLKSQLNLFYIAVGFLTRIPVPQTLDYSQQNLNRASRYFAFVGWIIGLLSALVFGLSILILPKAVAILLAMAFSALVTGCFHEDGLADTCDGLGGGWTAPQKLAIMKDSRIGTYGSVGLWFALSLKFALLWSLEYAALALIVAHPLSRSVSTCLISWLPYVSEESHAKSKPLAEKQCARDLQLNIMFGLLAMLLVPFAALWLLILLFTLLYSMRWFLRKQIGGFTGDTLGAIQQLSEILIYAVILATGVSG